jgi:hypothetical protein
MGKGVCEKRATETQTGVRQMTKTTQKHFYAKDYVGGEMTVAAFATKEARDTFVNNGNRRFSLTAKEADKACMKLMHCNSKDAVLKGFI